MSDATETGETVIRSRTCPTLACALPTCAPTRGWQSPPGTAGSTASALLDTISPHCRATECLPALLSLCRAVACCASLASTLAFRASLLLWMIASLIEGTPHCILALPFASTAICLCVFRFTCGRQTSSGAPLLFTNDRQLLYSLGHVLAKADVFTNEVTT